MKTKINGLSVNTFGNKGNKAIIFVHGFPYDHQMWENQYEYFSKDYYCIAYDIRGLGESEVGDGQYTMELFVDDLFQIVEELKLGKPAVCGLSMGGYLLLNALQRTDRLFSAVILADTHAKADDNAGKLKRANAIKTINTKGLDVYIDGFVPGTFSKETNESKPEFFTKTIERCKQNSPIGVKGSQLAMLSRLSSEEFLSSINVPVLVIAGEYDSLTPPNVMKEMSEKIPKSEFFVIENAAHMSPLENPEKFNSILELFLKKTL